MRKTYSKTSSRTSSKIPSAKLAILVIILTSVGGWFLWQNSDIDLANIFTKSPTPIPYTSPYVNTPIAQNSPKSTSANSNPQTQTPKQSHPIKEPPHRQPPSNQAPISSPANETSSSDIQITGKKPNYDRKIIERAIGTAVNRQRLNRGLSKLKWRKDLASVGRKFSREIVADAQAVLDKNEKLTKIPLRHDGAIFGDTNLSRLYNKEVFDFSTAGENIISLPLLTPSSNNTYRWKTIEEIADESALRWTLSPTHMRNIVIARYTHTGIGAVLIDNFLVATQLFIAEVNCGYPDGKCCKPEESNNENKQLFCYGTNTCNRQSDDEMKCDLKNKE